MRNKKLKTHQSKLNKFFPNTKLTGESLPSKSNSPISLNKSTLKRLVSILSDSLNDRGFYGNDEKIDHSKFSAAKKPIFTLWGKKNKKKRTNNFKTMKYPSEINYVCRKLSDGKNSSDARSICLDYDQKYQIRLKDTDRKHLQSLQRRVRSKNLDVKDQKYELTRELNSNDTVTHTR